LAGTWTNGLWRGLGPTGFGGDLDRRQIRQVYRNCFRMKINPSPFDGGGWVGVSDRSSPSPSPSHNRGGGRVYGLYHVTL